MVQKSSMRKSYFLKSVIYQTHVILKYLAHFCKLKFTKEPVAVYLGIKV